MIFTGTVGKVWDPLKNNVLCDFTVSGICTTTDPYIIKRLKELGYEEAAQDNLVSIDICNGINVDWREKHDVLQERYRALKGLYVGLEQKLKDIEETMDIPVAPKESIEKAEERVITETYNLNGFNLPKNFTEMSIFQLKPIMSKQMNYSGDVRKLTKDECIKYITKHLIAQGYME